MRWIRRPNSIVPRGGTALAGLGALIALLPLALAAEDAGGGDRDLTGRELPRRRQPHWTHHGGSRRRARVRPQPRPRGERL